MFRFRSWLRFRLRLRLKRDPLDSLDLNLNLSLLHRLGLNLSLLLLEEPDSDEIENLLGRFPWLNNRRIDSQLWIHRRFIGNL